MFSSFHDKRAGASAVDTIQARRASPDGPLRLYLLDSSVSVKRNYVRRSRRTLR